jgi:hypothetical protein
VAILFSVVALSALLVIVVVLNFSARKLEARLNSLIHDQTAHVRDIEQRVALLREKSARSLSI